MTIPRPLAIASLALLAAMAPVAAPLAAQDVEIARTLKSWHLGDARVLTVDLTLGDLTVEGSDRHDVEAELVLRCDRVDLERCRERAQRIYLAPRIRGERFDVLLKRTPRGRAHGITATLVLRVPRNLPVEIDLRGGDVLVTGHAASLEVDAAAGDVALRYPQRLVGSVKAAVGVGNVDLWVADAHMQGSGFPRSLHWNGTGTIDLEVDLGTGDVTVTLE